MNWKQVVWPVERGEFRLFALAIAIATLININFSILRSAKAALVIADSAAGALALPYLHLWAAFPASVVITAVIARLMRRVSGCTVFQIAIGGFLVGLLLFVFVLYPNRVALQPHVGWTTVKGVDIIIGQWTSTFFYVLAELWKAVILSMLFMGFVNRRVSIEQAKRLYSPVVLGGSVGAILAGPLTMLASSASCLSLLPFCRDEWHASLSVQILMVVGFGLVVMILFGRLSRLLTGEARLAVKRKGLSFMSSLRFCLKSRYLVSLAVMVIIDYLIYSLSEVIFLDRLREWAPDPTLFCHTMGRLTWWSGLCTFFGALLIAPWLLQRFRWSIPAMITPAVLLLTGGGFCFAVWSQHASWLGSVATLFGATPLGFVVFLGCVQFCICRAAKYTLFDTTREIAFVPLDDETQVKGKLVIDGVASRFGRGAASVSNIGLLALFPTIAASAPCAGLLTAGGVLVWSLAVRSIGGQVDGEPEPPTLSLAH